MTPRARRLLALSTLASTLFAVTLHAGDPATDRFVYTGATAPGTTSITLSGGVYSFRFVGDETITYQLNIGDPKVAGGNLTISEVSSASKPIDGGGPVFRDNVNQNWFPGDLYKKTTLTSHAVSGKTLTLDFNLAFNGNHPIRYQLTLEGKALRIRVFDPTSSTSYANNFQGVYFGSTTGVEFPYVVHMQGTLVQPIVMFRNGWSHYFTAHTLDMLQSNASSYRLSDCWNPPKGVDWISQNIDTAAQYKPLSNGMLAAPLDDSYLICVSSQIKDVLLSTTAPKSPYHGVLSNRMFFDAPEKVWSYYSGMFDLYQSLGMYNLAGYFWNWSAAGPDAPVGTNLGPDWNPALDATNFQAMISKGINNGALLAAYTAFNCLPPTAPGSYIDPSRYVRDSAGNIKLYNGLNVPLVGVEASGLYAGTEIPTIRARGLNSAYLDIQTYGGLAKAPDGDHLDQMAGSPWAKTMRQGFAAQKTWFESMRTTLNGPLLGEGSIGDPNSNMEYLWYGYVDSVQRVINTGKGKHANEWPAGSPDAPTNWPIIPEYEWRVAARHQVNHGNGFYDRIFGLSEGSTIVNMATAETITPITQDARDLYNAMAISYGHAGFLITNGTQTTHEGYITHPGAAETYFMTNALQAYMFSVPVLGINYYWHGSFKSFEQILFLTETTDTFRKIPLVISFANGMRIYVNNSTSSLNVSEGGINYKLPARTGWLAYCEGQLLAFSAIPPGTNNNRIDYVNAAGQYEYFNGRGVVSGYGSLTTTAKRTKYKVHSSNLTVEENASGILQTTTGTAPTVSEIRVYPGGNQHVGIGERVGLRAIAFYSNNSVREVTTLIKWTSSNPTVATTNDSGVVRGNANGTTTITSTAFGGKSIAPFTLSVP